MVRGTKQDAIDTLDEMAHPLNRNAVDDTALPASEDRSTASESGISLKTVDNALRVLETFTVESPEMGVTEISERVGLHKSVVFRILHTLAARGYIEQVETSRKFRLGLKAFEIGSRAVNQLGLGSLIQPSIDRLAAECNETVNVGVLSGCDIIYVNKVVPQRVLRLDVQSGARLPAHRTALGKCILAYTSEKELSGYIELSMKANPSDPKLRDVHKIHTEFAQIRRQGYAWSHEDLFEGITCVSAPLWDRRKNVFAAISIAMPTHRSKIPGRKEHLVEMVTKAANEISMLMDSLG